MDLAAWASAAQAGRGGAGQLTGQTPEETRFNLLMGYTNLVLAGLDVGLEVGLVQKLVLVPELLMASATLTREQSRVLIASLAQMKGEVSDAVVRKMIEAACDRFQSQNILQPSLDDILSVDQWARRAVLETSQSATVTVSLRS